MSFIPESRKNDSGINTTRVSCSVEYPETPANYVRDAYLLYRLSREVLIATNLRIQVEDYSRWSAGLTGALAKFAGFFSFLWIPD